MKVNEASRQLKDCVTGVYYSDPYDPIRRHIPLDGQYTLEQLTDASHSSDQEKAAIFQTHPRTEDCRRSFLTGITDVSPSGALIYTDLYSKSEDSLVRLIKGQITWGDHSTAVRANINEAKQRLTILAQQSSERLAQYQQQQAQNRQAAFAAIAQYYQNQQLINALARPVITNCSASANSATCITH